MKRDGSTWPQTAATDNNALPRSFFSAFATIVHSHQGQGTPSKSCSTAQSSYQSWLLPLDFRGPHRHPMPALTIQSQQSRSRKKQNLYYSNHRNRQHQEDLRKTFSKKRVNINKDSCALSKDRPRIKICSLDQFTMYEKRDICGCINLLQDKS